MFEYKMLPVKCSEDQANIPFFVTLTSGLHYSKLDFVD